MADLRLFPLLIVFISIITGLVAGAAVGFDQPEVVVIPGEMTTINLTLDSAPGGLAGYRIVIGIDDPSIGEITAVTLPEWAQIPEISGTPGPVVSITAVDLMSLVEQGAGGILLATISVKGLTPGTTEILLSDPEISDEAGFDILPVLSNASLTVTTEVSTTIPTESPTTTAPSTTAVNATISTGSSVLTSGSGGGGSGGGSSFTSSGMIPTTVAATETVTAGTTVTTAAGQPGTPVPESPVPETSPPALSVTVPGTATPVSGSQGIPCISVPGIMVLVGALVLLGRKMK